MAAKVVRDGYSAFIQLRLDIRLSGVGAASTVIVVVVVVVVAVVSIVSVVVTVLEIRQKSPFLHPQPKKLLTRRA